MSEQRVMVSRTLEQRSIRDLSFRHHLATRFDRATCRPDRDLHCTVALGDAQSLSLESLAAMVRNRPVVGGDTHIAKVTNVIPVGAGSSHGRQSYALELELDDRLAADYEYYHEHLDLPRLPYIPHVTLLRTQHTSAETKHALLNKIESQVPATIALAGIHTRLYTPSYRAAS